MRRIYIDEAGTSDLEPVRVVCSVIVEDGEERYRVEKELRDAVNEMVPGSIRDDFFIHAKDIFHGKNYRKFWSFNDRLDFLRSVSSIILSCELPVAIGIVHKGSYDGTQLSQHPKISVSEFEHIVAFSYCAERSDLFLRKYLEGEETGVIFAENVRERRRLLAQAAVVLKDNPITFESSHLRNERWHIELGIKPDREVCEILNILEAPNFIDKRDDPILQLADVCAFGFRRCLARHSHGDSLLRACLPPDEAQNFLEDEVWFSGTSLGLFNRTKYMSERHRKVAENKITAQIVLQALMPYLPIQPD